MTPDQATDLAARVLVAIERNDAPTGSQSVADYCREQVASDLAGLTKHAGEDAGERDCERCFWSDGLSCDDRDRYTAGLLRTAALYGVTP